MEPKSSAISEVKTKTANNVANPQEIAELPTLARVESCTNLSRCPDFIAMVPLTRGYCALVSPRDLARVSQIKWRAVTDDEGRVYARAHKPGSGTRNETLMLHRFILDVTESKVKVDHHDGNGLNNWRSNLRECTNAQNIRNQRPHQTGKVTSKFKGVYKRPDGRYRSQIMHQYVKINLGTFETELEAAETYNAAALKLHGQFARVNPLPRAPILPFPSGFAADYSRAVLGGGQ